MNPGFWKTYPSPSSPSEVGCPLMAGLGGLLVSSLPLGVWVWKKVPDWQARRRQLSRKQFLTQCSVSLGQLEKRFASNNAEIKDHYQDLEQISWKVHPLFLGYTSPRADTCGVSGQAEAGAAPPPSKVKPLLEFLTMGRAAAMPLIAALGGKTTCGRISSK